MSKKSTVIFLMGFLFLESVAGFAQERESEQADKIKDLIGVLDTWNWDRAMDELVKIVEPAVDPFLEVLRSNTRFTSARSCYALTRIGTQEAVDAVMEALKNSPLSSKYSMMTIGKCGCGPRGPWKKSALLRP